MVDPKSIDARVEAVYAALLAIEAFAGVCDPESGSGEGDVARVGVVLRSLVVAPLLFVDELRREVAVTL